MVNTLPAADPWAFLRIKLCQKGVDQRRLANAGLACHQPNLPLAVTGGGPPLLELREFCLTVDEHGAGGDHTAGGTGRGGGSGLPVVNSGHRRHKTVAPSVHGGNALGVLGRLPQDLAQLTDARGEHPLRHTRLRPDRLQESCFTD